MNYQQIQNNPKNEINQTGQNNYLLNPYYSSNTNQNNKSYSPHDNRLFDNSVNSNNYTSFCSSLNSCKMRPQASQIDQASYQLPKVNQDMPYLSDRDLFSQNTRVPQSQDPNAQLSPNSQINSNSQMNHPNFAYDQTNQSYLSQFNLNVPNSSTNQKNMSIFDRTMENYAQRK
jgi:hypothetical protein